MSFSSERQKQRIQRIEAWLPQECTKENLELRKSILWNDSTLWGDVQLLKFIMSHNISYSSFRNEDLKGLQRIFENIQAEAWRNQYPVTSFVFCDYYAKQIRIADITTVLYAQAVEVLVMSLGLKAGSDFGQKFNHLFERIYEEKLKKDIPTLLRVMRNNAAHLAQVDSAMNLENNVAPTDKALINSYAEKYYHGNVSSMFHSFSAAFDSVVEDMIFRSLDPEFDQVHKYNLTGYRMFSEKFSLD